MKSIKYGMVDAVDTAIAMPRHSQGGSRQPEALVVNIAPKALPKNATLP